jgi:branched-chain amino acid transport system substrate-binding protein
MDDIGKCYLSSSLNKPNLEARNSSLSLDFEKMLKLIAFLIVLMPALCFGGGTDILLGQVVSVSNPLVGEISSELKSGYEAYFTALNELGGIDGRKVRLVQKDDGYVAGKTLSLTRELVESDKVVALVGYLGTPGVEALVRENVLVDGHIALVGPSTGVARLLSEKNVFPIRASYESELAEIVSHAKAMQHKTVAFIAWNVGAGQILAKAFPAVVAEGGLKLANQAATFDPSPDPAKLKQALSGAIEPLRRTRPDAVVLVAGGNALYEGIRQLRSQLGTTLSIYTISSVNWKDLVNNLGREFAQGVVISQAVPYPYSPRLAIVKEYLARMRRMGRDANYYSFEGYLGAAVTAEALRRASPNITRSNVTAALNGLGRYQIGGFEVSYTPERRQGFERPETTLITSRGTLLR